MYKVLDHSSGKEKIALVTFNYKKAEDKAVILSKKNSKISKRCCIYIENTKIPINCNDRFIQF